MIEKASENLRLFYISKSEKWPLASPMNRTFAKAAKNVLMF
jgi:hypothetical protein